MGLFAAIGLKEAWGTQECELRNPRALRAPRRGVGLTGTRGVLCPGRDPRGKFCFGEGRFEGNTQAR